MKEIKTNAPTAKSGGRRLRNDIIFIAVLLVAVSLIGLGYFFLRGEGDTVEVSVDGEVFGEYSLSIDREVEIKTELGYNLLVIKNGEAEVEIASCPDGICSAHRPISKEGESIVCLPNKVVVTVRASEGDLEPDIIS